MTTFLNRLFCFIVALTIAGSPLFSFSQQVKDAQVLLNSLGFDAGLEDGLDGRRTKLALIEFYASQSAKLNKSQL